MPKEPHRVSEKLYIDTVLSKIPGLTEEEVKNFLETAIACGYVTRLPGGILELNTIVYN